MKITIDIPDRDVEILKKWASISRTLNTAKEACDIAAHSDDSDTREKMNYCEQELDVLEPMLNNLHVAVREQLKIEALKDEDKQKLGYVLRRHSYYAQES